MKNFGHKIADTTTFLVTVRRGGPPAASNESSSTSSTAIEMDALRASLKSPKRQWRMANPKMFGHTSVPNHP